MASSRNGKIGMSGTRITADINGNVSLQGGDETCYAIQASPPLIKSDSASCYLYRYPCTLTTARRYNELHAYVPVDDKKHYFGVIFSARQIATAVASITDMGLFAPGLHVWHAACTKTGTWTTSGNTSAFGGDYGYSTTAGDTLVTTVTGSAIAIRLFQASNGGNAVVSIDGSYTLPNRLPTFTAADLAAGLCRSGDVGRPYISSYASTQFGDAILIADDLADTTHTVTIEVCRTKPAASSDYRVCIEGIAGCSASHSIGTANVHFVPLRWITHLDETTWNALTYVPKWAPLGSADYQFMGEIHADGTQSKEVQTALSIRVDNIDYTSLALGTYASGEMITIDQISTLAHKADTTTPVCTKRRLYTMAANRLHPLLCDITLTWLADGVMALEYPAMLAAAVYDRNTRIVNQPEINVWWIGNKRSDAKNAFDDASVASTDGHYTLQGAGNKVMAWASMLSASPVVPGLYANKSSFVQDRSYRDNKAYLITVTNPCTPYVTGTVQRFLTGYGAALFTI